MVMYYMLQHKTTCNMGYCQRPAITHPASCLAFSNRQQQMFTEQYRKEIRKTDVLLPLIHKLSLQGSKLFFFVSEETEGGKMVGRALSTTRR